MWNKLTKVGSWTHDAALRVLLEWMKNGQRTLFLTGYNYLFNINVAPRAQNCVNFVNYNYVAQYIE